MGEKYMTMAEIEATYRDQWVLLDRLTKDRRSDQVTGGRVVFHAPDRDEFDRGLDAALEGVGDCAIFYTGKPDPDEVWMLNL